MTSTVLFIDNDPLLLKSIRLSMRQESFRVLCVESTDEARLLMNRECIDLVVCDEHLPGTSGSEFLAEARDTHPGMVRIMLSGQSSVGAVVQAINGGEVFRFLLKPCGHGELLDTVHAGLAHKQFMDHCHLSLRLFRQQNDLLSQLREHHPEVFQESAPVASVAAVSGQPLLSIDSLNGEISHEIARASGLHRALAPGTPSDTLAPSHPPVQ